MENHSSISEFEALPRDEVLELLVQCILQLSPTQKTILAMYYHEELEPAEIAVCVGLTEGELDQVRVETVGLLRTMLAAQISLLLESGTDEVRRQMVLDRSWAALHHLGTTLSPVS